MEAAEHILPISKKINRYKIKFIMIKIIHYKIFGYYYKLINNIKTLNDSEEI